MLGVNQTVLVCVLLPPSVVALVGDVAFASPRLKLPEVQPGLIVLRLHTDTHGRSEMLSFHPIQQDLQVPFQNIN